MGVIEAIKSVEEPVGGQRMTGHGESEAHEGQHLGHQVIAAEGVMAAKVTAVVFKTGLKTGPKGDGGSAENRPVKREPGTEQPASGLQRAPGGRKRETPRRRVGRNPVGEGIEKCFGVARIGGGLPSPPQIGKPAVTVKKPSPLRIAVGTGPVPVEATLGAPGLPRPEALQGKGVVERILGDGVRRDDGHGAERMGRSAIKGWTTR